MVMGGVRHESGGKIQCWHGPAGWPGVRFREGTADELARARAAVGAWREANPLGSYEQAVAALGHEFHRDYRPVLRAVLYVIDKHRAHQVTGIITGAAGGRPVSRRGTAGGAITGLRFSRERLPPEHGGRGGAQTSPRPRRARGGS